MESLLIGAVLGVIGGLVAALIIFLLPPPHCEQCGVKLPRVRKPENTRQALVGGYICPNCGAQLDRKGREIK